MMREYDIPMSKALLWDFEGFGWDARLAYQDSCLNETFEYYLYQNNVSGTKAAKMYTEIFFGRSEDLILKKSNP